MRRRSGLPPIAEAPVAVAAAGVIATGTVLAVLARRRSADRGDVETYAVTILAEESAIREAWNRLRPDDAPVVLRTNTAPGGRGVEVRVAAGSELSGSMRELLRQVKAETECGQMLRVTPQPHGGGTWTEWVTETVSRTLRRQGRI
jgi:hypothetical protein